MKQKGADACVTVVAFPIAHLISWKYGEAVLHFVRR